MIDNSIGNSFAGRMHFPGTVLMVEGTFQKHLALSSGFNRGAVRVALVWLLSNSVFKVPIWLSDL